MSVERPVVTDVCAEIATSLAAALKPNDPGNRPVDGPRTFRRDFDLINEVNEARYLEDQKFATDDESDS